MNWAPELENGELLSKASTADIDVFLTADQNIPYQQNLARLELALVVLNSNLWPRVRASATAILRAIEKATPGSYQVVSIPDPPGRREPPSNR
jgi:hypothetical protein